MRSGLQIQKLSLDSSVPLKLFTSMLKEENDDDGAINYLHYSHRFYKI